MRFIVVAIKVLSTVQLAVLSTLSVCQLYVGGPHGFRPLARGMNCDNRHARNRLTLIGILPTLLSGEDRNANDLPF